ncbi:hypothetical protein [Marinobacter sp. PE14]
MRIRLEFKHTPVFIVMSEEWADQHHPLEFPLSFESSLHGLIESQGALLGQREDGKLVASDIEVTREKGISMEFPGMVLDFPPQYLDSAWKRLGLENRPYTGREVTLGLILALMVFKPRKKQGGRGEGRADADSIVCLVNLVHGCLYLSEREGKEMSIRTAVGMVVDAIKDGTEYFRYPVLLPDDGVIPWPDSWTTDGATPDTPQGLERLRKRVTRDRSDA